MVLHHGGFPIRKSADIMLIYNPPQLIAVNRVLLRLLMPRHSPYALVRLNFPMLFSCSELYEFHLNMVLFTLREKAICLFWIFPPRLHLCRLRWNCSYYPNIGKTLNSIDLVNLMSSISVRFNSFLFFYSIFNEHKLARRASSEEWKVLVEKASLFLPFLFSFLSYLFSCRLRRLVGLDGLEPSTSRLSGVRSSHLSYKPFHS